jgi:hypothetical protein
MIEYHRGSRVETYTPLFDLAAKLVSEKVLPSAAAAVGVENGTESGGSTKAKKKKQASTRKSEESHKEEEEEEEGASQKTQQEQETSVDAEFFQPSLSNQIYGSWGFSLQPYCE